MSSGERLHSLISVSPPASPRHESRAPNRFVYLRDSRPHPLAVALEGPQCGDSIYYCLARPRQYYSRDQLHRLGW